MMKIIKKMRKFIENVFIIILAIITTSLIILSLGTIIIFFEVIRFRKIKKNNPNITLEESINITRE